METRACQRHPPVNMNEFPMVKVKTIQAINKYKSAG
jgi:hypothetical protein